MRTNDRIAKLQDLLERVQTRALEPRTSNVDPLAMAASEQPDDIDSDVNSDPDVEISSEVVEIDIDVDDVSLIESGAQRIAPSVGLPDDVDEVEPAMAMQSSGPPAEEASSFPPPPPANEIEEPAPSSSRRPKVDEIENAAPRTPPPESGKQVAPAPSAYPPARMASVAPAADEDQTIMGGWREPGLGASPTAAASGIRVPTPASEIEVPAFTRASSSAHPDVTRPTFGTGSGEIATFEGGAPIPKPATLGELLDMTLSL